MDSQERSLATTNGASDEGSTFVDAQIESVETESGYRDCVDINTGEIAARVYTGITTRSMTARDLMSGRLLENLPGALNCQPGDIVRITVEVIQSNAK